MVTFLRGDSDMAVWWATRVECVSALVRQERAGGLAQGDVALAVDRLDALNVGWHEVQPTERLREHAVRILRTHPLRAADGLQLAAALVAAEGDPAGLGFVCLDDRLAEAGRREGFRVVELQ